MAQIRILGSPNPEIGKEETYTIETGFLNPGFLPYLSQSHMGMAKDTAHWGIYVLEEGRWRIAKENYKSGDSVTYTFRTNSKTRQGIKIVVVKGNSSGELIVKPRNATAPGIISVELLDAYGNKITKPLHYKDTVRAKAHCAGMFGQAIYLSLWEDDSKGAGHNPASQFIAKKAAIVDAYGMAEASFSLLATYMSLAMKREEENKKHEYYVTAEFFGIVKAASRNANVENSPLPAPKPIPKPGSDIKDYPSPKDVPKPQRPKDKPRAETPKFPGTTGARTSKPDSKGHITKVEFKNAKGQPLTKTKYGDVIRVIISGTNLKGKSFILKIWEDDTAFDDKLYEQALTFTADTVHHQFTLTADMQNKGNDWEWEGKGQELFAEIIMPELTVKSGIMNVDENAEFEMESGVSAVTVGDGKKDGKKEDKNACPNCDKDITLNDIKKICVAKKNSKGEEKCLITDLVMITAALPFLNEYRKQAKINTCVRKAHFLAQIAQESKFYSMQEDFTYKNPKRMRDKFYSYFKGFGNEDKQLEEAKRLSNLSLDSKNHKEVANAIYGNKHPNGKNHTDPDDGWRYSGKGFKQITWKDNYVALQKYVKDTYNIDVEWVGGDNPYKLKNNAKDAMLSAIAYWGKIILIVSLIKLVMEL
jgi:predicted chitinase